MNCVAAIRALIAGIETGYFHNWEWFALAERQITEPGQPPTWVIDLYQAAEAKSALGALWTGFQQIELSEQGWDDLTGLQLGFLYLRYLDGAISLNEFLNAAGNESDNANYDYPPCETIFALLNEYEKSVRLEESPEPIAGKADMMFTRHLRLAEEALATLKTETV